MRASTVLFIALLALISLSICLYYSRYKDETQPGDIGKLIIEGQTPASLKRDYIDCQLSYINRFGDQIFLKMDGEIRVRGNASTLYPKKSLALKFPKKLLLGKLPKSKNWILVPNYLDMTFLRNKLSYDLFNSFDPKNQAPLTEFVEVYFGDEYYGLFVLTQRIDAEMLGLAKTGLLFKDPPLNFPPSEHQTNLEEYRRFLRDVPQIQLFSESSRTKMINRAYYNQRYPKFEKEDRKEALIQLTQVIFESSDSLFNDPAHGINSHFDLNNIMDWHLLLLFTNNYDGIKKNYYLYRKNEHSLYKICPWDYDHGYGRDGDGEPHPDLLIEFERLTIFKRLLELNPVDYRERLKKRYEFLNSQEGFNKKEVLEIIAYHKYQLNEYLSKNQDKWPLNDQKYFSETSTEKEFEMLEEWVKNRFDVMETYLDSIQ